MKVEQLLEQIDDNIKLLNESLFVSTSLDKSEVKERYGSRKTYDECVSMERGALTSMISLRQWIIINKKQKQNKTKWQQSIK